VIVGQNTFLIERENSWHVQLTVYDTVSQNFFHHFLFGRLTICSTNEIALLDLGNWLAFFVVTA